MKPGGQRRKGRAFEQDIARRLRKFYPKARRGLTQAGGAIEPDVAGTPWWIECKHGRKVDLLDAVRQADRDYQKNPHGYPYGSVVVWKPNNDNVYVVWKPNNDNIYTIWSDELHLPDSEISLFIHKFSTFTW